MTTPLAAAAYVVGVVTCVALAAAVASRWAHADALDRALAAVVTAASLPVAVALVLGMVGLLSPWPFLAVMATVGVASAAWLVGKPPPADRAPAAWSFSGTAATAGAAALGFLAVVPTLAGRRSQHVETANYHITNLATWVRRHSIWELPFQNPGFFTATHPGNGELLSAGMLFATGGDQLAYLGNLLFAALAVLGCAMAARELDGRPDLAALAALALVGAPIVFATQAHSLATDLPAAAGLVAGVAALLRARRTHDVRWVVAAGFALGLALGSKYTALLLVPLVVGVAAAGLRPRRAALWLAPGLVLMAAPWFVRNLLATGNPFFPQPVGIAGFEVFGGGVSPLLELKTTILDHLLAGNLDVLGLWARVSGQLYGPAALLVVVGIAAAFFGGPRRRERLAVAGIAAAAVVVYAITPYTGGGPEGLPFLLGSNIRYTMTAAFLGVALAPVVLPSRLLVVVSAAAFGYNGWRMARGYGFRTDLDLRGAVVAVVVVALALGACAGLIALGRRRVALGPIAVAAGGAAALALVVAGLWRIDGSAGVLALERALSRTGRQDVMVLGVQDMRSVLGRELEAGVRTVSAGGRAGETPPQTQQELNEAVRNSDTDVLVVRDGTPGVPEGWEPPGDWSLAASTRSGDVYVRTPPTATPSPPPAPDQPQPSAPDQPQPSTPPAPSPPPAP